MTSPGLMASLLAATCWMGVGTVDRAVDGDTLSALIRVWPNVLLTERVRVLGVNTPELKGPTLEAGRAAMAFSDRWVRDAGGRPAELRFRTCGRDSFGRLLADVYRGTDHLATDLIAAGHGRPYRDGR